MLKRRVGQYYVKTTYCVMLVDDMTEGGIYGLHMVNDIYPEGDGDPSDFIVPTPSKKDLRDKING